MQIGPNKQLQQSLKEHKDSPLKNNFRTATSEAKTKPKPLKCNLQDPQLNSEGVSLGVYVQKCEEMTLLSTNKCKYIERGSNIEREICV